MINRKTVSVYYAEFEAFIRGTIVTEEHKISAGNLIVQSSSAMEAMENMLGSTKASAAESASIDKRDVFVLLHDFRFIEAVEVRNATNDGD